MLGLEPKEGAMLAEDIEVLDAEVATDDEVDELLVEEVSIDGMCGVY
jgi:mycofactocin precursor